MGLKDH